MHGYLMHIKLYQKLKAKQNPFEFEAYKQQLVDKNIEL